MAIDISPGRDQAAGLREYGKDWVSPLQKIEEQRRQNVKESQEQQKIDIMGKEADTNQYSANTRRMTENREQAQDDLEKAMLDRMKKLNALYKPTAVPGTPEYERQFVRYANVLATDEQPDIAEYGRTLIGSQTDVLKATEMEPGQGSMGSRLMEAETAERSARAGEAIANERYLNSFPANQAPGLDDAAVGESMATINRIEQEASKWLQPWTWQMWAGKSQEEKIYIAGVAVALQEEYRANSIPISIGQATEKVLAGEVPGQLGPAAAPYNPGQGQQTPAAPAQPPAAPVPAARPTPGINPSAGNQPLLPGQRVDFRKTPGAL